MSVANLEHRKEGYIMSIHPNMFSANDLVAGRFIAIHLNRRVEARDLNKIAAGFGERLLTTVSYLTGDQGVCEFYMSSDMKADQVFGVLSMFQEANPAARIEIRKQTVFPLKECS